MAQDRLELTKLGLLGLMSAPQSAKWLELAKASKLDVNTDFQGLDLSGEDLSHGDFLEFDFSRTNFIDALVEGARFNATANLNGALGKPSYVGSERRPSFVFDDLLSAGRGELFNGQQPYLPLPPMLMVDAISKITDTGGKYNRGFIEAEFAFHPDRWFFQCYNIGDPFLPPSLVTNGLFSLLGFWLAWHGAEGRPRALGMGECRIPSQGYPSSINMNYRVDLKRVIQRRINMIVADAAVLIDGILMMEVNDLRVGLFLPTESDIDP